MDGFRPWNLGAGCFSTGGPCLQETGWPGFGRGVIAPLIRGHGQETAGLERHVAFALVGKPIEQPICHEMSNAAAVEPRIAGVILGDCPHRHDGETALLGVLRFGDLPTFAGLLFPRPFVLTGEQDKGFEWTANLYQTLGSGASFQQVEANAESVIAKLP